MLHNVAALDTKYNTVAAPIKWSRGAVRPVCGDAALQSVGVGAGSTVLCVGRRHWVGGVWLAWRHYVRRWQSIAYYRIKRRLN